MSQNSIIQTRQKNYRLSVDSFNGIKMNANEPWLYSIWYLITSGIPAFLSGIVWSPLAIAWFGTFYSPISQTIVLAPAGELFRDGAQIMTGLLLYISQFAGMYRTILKGHGNDYIIQTIRFKGDEYTIVPFVVDNNNIKDLDQNLTDIPFHKSLVPVSIPYPLSTMFKIRNLGIGFKKFFGAAKNKSYWKTYQPFDYELMIHEGTQKDTFRYHEGKVPFMNVLLKAPHTLPLGTTVYFSKQYEIKEKPIPIVFIHDSPYSTDKVLKLGGLEGLKSTELKTLDTQFNAYTAREKDEHIEQLELEIVRLEASLTAEQNRKDKEIAEDRQWVGGGLDDEPVNKAASKLFSRNGLIGLTGFAIFVVAILAMWKAHWIG